MRALRDADLVRIWEQGWSRDPIGRVLVLLSLAFPERPPAELADLSLGQRDAGLLRLREQLFGPTVTCYAECPACGERLEYDLDIRHLAGGAPAADPVELRLVAGEVQVDFRLPTTRDLAAAAACASVGHARQELVRRCVLAASHAGGALSPEQLPEPVLDGLSAQMAAADPQAECLLDLRCPACAHGWQEVFDIAGCLWAEITAAARRLLTEVAALARTYGWSEAEILRMSPLRRQFYLNL